MLQRSGLKRLLNERVVVQPAQPGLDTLAGVLVGDYNDCVELAHPEVVDGDRRDPVKGPALLLKQHVHFVQRDS